MKKIFILLIFISNCVFAANPNYDVASSIVFFPRVTVDNNVAYNNVQLLLNANKIWSILAAEPENNTINNSSASVSNYDSLTGIVFFPTVTVNNSTNYNNVKLLLGADGIWSILAAEEEKPELFTGDYIGSTTSNISTNFNAPLSGDFTQNGNQLTGEIFIDSMLGSISGNLTGQINGNNVVLVIELLDFASEISFNGTISNDNKTFSGSYQWPALNDTGTWTLTKQ
ncbi:MAG: hypothetical protein KAH20_01035 [Methylococcales bacterium]|nr:hypothetical protein [Methylococcales bacterium]